MFCTGYFCEGYGQSLSAGYCKLKLTEFQGIVTSSARSHGFPLPLSSAAEQLYLSASSQGFGKEDDSGLVRTFTPTNPSLVHEQAKSAVVGADELTPSVTPQDIHKIGFIGLGAMGSGMA